MAEDELKAQIAALQERIAALEARGRPTAPFKADPTPIRDLTANASMSPSTMQEFARAVPTAVIREIANGDRVRAELRPLGRGYTTRPLPRSRHLSAAPLEVPGVALADKIVDAQDARDRADAIDREARRRALTPKADDVA